MGKGRAHKKAKRAKQLQAQQALKILFRLGANRWEDFLTQAQNLGLTERKAMIIWRNCVHEFVQAFRHPRPTYGHDIVSTDDSVAGG